MSEIKEDNEIKINKELKNQKHSGAHIFDNEEKEIKKTSLDKAKRKKLAIIFASVIYPLIIIGIVIIFLGIFLENREFLLFLGFAIVVITTLLKISINELAKIKF